MSKDADVEASVNIISIAAKYIVSSVILIAIGLMSLVYSILTYFVYGSLALPYVILGAFFIGVAFIVIGIFLVFWGLYWMRSEGKRLRKKLAPKAEGRPSKHNVTWDDVAEKSYDRIQYYGSRFLIIGTIGVVIGFIGNVYAFLNIAFFAAVLQDLSVFLGIFVGVGAIVGSIVLLLWGMFLRKQTDERTLF